MAMAPLHCLSVALGLFTCIVAGKVQCRPAEHPVDGGNSTCSVDGAGCVGTPVQFDPYVLNLTYWDATHAKPVPIGHMNSWFILGKNDTWQMYLHGPKIHANAQKSDTLPDTYVFATWTNQIYKFENFSLPQAGQPLKATQKMVGYADAPSTGFLIEREIDKSLAGVMVAEGQPFYVSVLNRSAEVSLGGVEFFSSNREKNCTSLFPLDSFHKKMGQVVNTVDCHKQHGVCFFSVWKFYDDQSPFWNPVVEKVANDCLYYCIVEDGSLDGTRTDGPKCAKTEILLDEYGDPICHKKGVGAVHGMTVGNDASHDPTAFDILLVFTGKAEMTNGESSMKKVRVQMVEVNGTTDIRSVSSETFATDLFEKYPHNGFDVGGDHAWVDDTGKYVWVSCFRQEGVGVHMLDYETGELLYSLTGIGNIVPGQYTYTAGLHGIGTLGKKGSYVAVATSSCHDIKMCIPTVPWHWPVPKDMWTTAAFIIIDLSSFPHEFNFHKGASPQIIV